MTHLAGTMTRSHSSRPHVTRRTAFRQRVWRSIALAAAALTLWGCPSEDKTPAKTPDGGQQARDTEIEHESCDLTAGNAKQRSVDEQGPVIISVMNGPTEACRAVDLNRDGVIDVFVYFDGAGQERRRESAFGRDGLPNEVSIYAAGTLIRKERETNNDARIDTWDYYEGGRLMREERDSTGDGYIDQWWTFNRPDKPECAVVLSDENGDGKADEQSRIDMCKDMVDAPAPPPTPDKPADDKPADDKPAAAAGDATPSTATGVLAPKTDGSVSDVLQDASGTAEGGNK